MKRHRELINKILKYAELHADDGMTDCIPRWDNTDPVVVDYHVRLCQEAGLVRAEQCSQLVGCTTKRAWRIISLTWEGHEYIDGAGL